MNDKDIKDRPHIVHVGLDSPHFPGVIALHAARKSRLGRVFKMGNAII